MVKVLVVGATGFLGSAIAKEAASKGHKVTALVSSESQSKKKEDVQALKSAGIEITTGSLDSDTRELVDVLKTVEVVSVLYHRLFLKIPHYILHGRKYNSIGRGTTREGISLICCRDFELAVMGLSNHTRLHHILQLSDYLRTSTLPFVTSSGCAGDLCC